VDPRITFHKLSMFSETRPVSQKKKKSEEERRMAAKVEADKLLKVGFIKEVRYTTCLANVVLIKNANGK